jgi:hypothetical protein
MGQFKKGNRPRVFRVKTTHLIIQLPHLIPNY